MTILPQELIDTVLANIDIDEVLNFLDYRTETIQKTDKAIRCFCPVHKEQVFRTLSFDLRTRKGRCSYTPCPAHTQHNLVDLVAMTHDIEPIEAVTKLAEHFNINLDLASFGIEAPQQTAAPEPANEQLMETSPEPVAETITEPEPEPEPEPTQTMPEPEPVAEEPEITVTEEQEEELFQPDMPEVQESPVAETPPEPEAELEIEIEPEPVKEEAVAPPPPPPPPPKPITPYEAAMQAIEDGNLEEACDKLVEIVERDPGNLDALEKLVDTLTQLGREDEVHQHERSLAQLYSNRNRIDDASQLYGHIVDSHPEDIELRLRYAECLHRQDNNDAMIAQMFTVGDLFEKAEEWDKALEIYRRIDAFQPGLDSTSEAIERVLIKSGRSDEASALILQQAQDLLNNGDTQGAIEKFQNILEIDASRDDVRQRVIQAMLSLESLNESAVEQCLEIIDGFSEQVDQQGVVDSLEEINQRFPENIAILERLYKAYDSQGRKGDADQLAFDLANFYYDNEDYDESLKWVETLIADNGAGIANALALKAEICQQQGDVPGALDAMTQIIIRHEDAGEVTQALPLYRAVLELAPEDMDMQIRYLWALQHAGQDENFIERAIAILPNILELEEDKTIEILEQLYGKCENAPLEDRITIMRTYGQKLQDTGQAADARALLINTADLLLDNAENNQAIEILEGLMEIDKNDLTVLEKLADAHVNADNQNRATEIYRSLADLYGEQGALDQQLDVLLKVVESHPEDLDILNQMLSVYDQIGNVRDAREMRIKIADILCKRGEHDQAVEYVRAILETDENDIDALKKIVSIYESLNDQSNLREYGMRLLQIHLKNETTDEAADLIAMLESHFPGDTELVLLQIRTFANEDAVKECIDLIDKQIVTSEESGEQEQALEFLKKILDISPELDAQLFTRWMQVCTQTNSVEQEWDTTESIIERAAEHIDVDTVIDSLTDIIDDNPDFEAARSQQILLLESSGKNNEAVDALQEWAHYSNEKGNKDDANRYFQRALDKAPNDIDLLNEVVNFRSEAGFQDGLADLCARLAELLETNGLVSQAIQALETGLKHAPKRQDLRQKILILDEMVATPDQLKKRYAEMSANKMTEGDFLAAQSVLLEAINRFPMELDQRYKLVNLLRDMGLQSEMLTELGNIAQIQAETGDLEGASETINEVLDTDPENIRAQAIQAEIHDQLGDEKRALSEYRDLSRKIATQAAEAGKKPQPAEIEEINDDTLTMLPINEHYSFEHFIVGSRNNFAFATAKAIADNPGGDYNPLFLHGDVGLGKTHLLQAILIHLREKNPDLAVLYTSAEEFTNALIESIQTNTVRNFRKIYKSADCLLIDDVHFLAEKERAQEEFFQIFNTLYQANKQIVLTCDRPPKEIPHLERRLRSRFGAGIIVDIQSPDLETRVAIVRSEAEEAGIEIEDAVLNHIAERISTNVRELKSVLNQILARTRIGDESLTAELVTEIVGQVANDVPGE